MLDRSLMRGMTICAFAAAFLWIAPSARTELANEAEMRQVCVNWLTQAVHERGSWADSREPHIGEVAELRDGGHLLARCYQIEPDGFVVVSVLKEMVPVKAYAEHGRLDPEDTGGLPALLRDVLGHRIGIYERAFGSLDATQPPDGQALFGYGQKASWDRLTMESAEFKTDLTAKQRLASRTVGPLLTTSWHQRGPYNASCPSGQGGQCVAGCVATAAAQIMAFWQWPTSGVGTVSYIWDGDQSCGGSVGGGLVSATLSDSYDWANIPDSCDAGCTPTQAQALGELNFEVAAALKSDFGCCGTSTTQTLGPSVYPGFFKYSPDIEHISRTDYTLDSWAAAIEEEIDAGRPMQYGIHSHSIVCDGYREEAGQFQYYMNYGWGNAYNAWYIPDSLFCFWIPPDSLCPPAYEHLLRNIKPQTEPHLRIETFSVDDPSGNDNGHADINETVGLFLTVVNKGDDADAVTVTLSGASEYYTPILAQTSAGAIPGWGGQVTAATPLILHTGTGCPDPSLLPVEVTLSDISAALSMSTRCSCS